MVPRPELRVDEPFQEDALEAARLDAPFVARGNLSHVEVAEQVPVEPAEIETRRVGRYGRVLEEERVALLAGRLRLRRGHLQPAHGSRAGRAPRVHRADLERAEIARTDAADLIVDAENRLTAQHVEAFLVGVDVRRERAAGRKLGDGETGVDRPGGVIDERRLPVAVAVPVVDGMTGKRSGVEVPEVVHGGLISSRVAAYKRPTTNAGHGHDAAGHSLYRRRNTRARAAARERARRAQPGQRLAVAARRYLQGSPAPCDGIGARSPVQHL